METNSASPWTPYLLDRAASSARNGPEPPSSPVPQSDTAVFPGQRSERNSPQLTPFLLESPSPSNMNSPEPLTGRATQSYTTMFPGQQLERNSTSQWIRSLLDSPSSSTRSSPEPSTSPVPQSYAAMSAGKRFERNSTSQRTPHLLDSASSSSRSSPEPSVSPAPQSIKNANHFPSTARLTSAPLTVTPTAPKAAWTGLGRFQKVLTTTAGAFKFGPLKMVIDDLARCIEMHEDAAAARREYKALKEELEAIFSSLSTHFSGEVPPTMTASMNNLCIAIEKELDRISSKEERGRGHRHLEAKKDLDEVMECYHRIRGHLGRLTLNADLNVWKIVDEQATETRLKSLAPSLSACHDSAAAATVRRRECTPKTREQVLTDLSIWRHDRTQGNIFWMNGMAGTGKTTIATSLCVMLKRAHELGASFFCTRQLPECRNVNLILPTIAYQLARFSRPFRCALSRALERDPDVHTKTLDTQLEGLIIDPIREVTHALPTDLVVVIDALDECEDDNGVGQVLELLVRHASDLPIKVFVSSRPEPQIRQRLYSTKSQLVLHELDDKIVKGDIEVYMRAELAGVSVSESQLANLVGRAGVLFIYAATVIRYIKAKNFRSGQQERLTHVLSALPKLSSNKNKEIDALYSLVLGSAFSNPDLEEVDKDRMRLVLHTVVCAQEPLTISALTGLLQLGDSDSVHDALEPMWSVLHVSDSGADSIVATLHASFPDYMLDPQRSAAYSCDSKSHHGRLAELCFQRIHINKPQFNICGLASSYVLDEQVLGLEDMVKQWIPADLTYACHYWAVHLELGGPSSEHVKLLDRFLATRLLLWMEVLNLRKRMNIGPVLLEKAKKWCTSRNDSSDTKDLVHDAWRFTTTFAANTISRSTPHLYVSMLAAWPKSMPVARRYAQRTNNLVNVTGTAMERRELELLGVIATGTPVNSVAFSPDGARIVSGFKDHTIRVWDGQSGQMVVEPLRGHTRSIPSVAYSPDGMRIASGSKDKTIRVWDAQTGQMVIGPLQGHTGSVLSVAFSPDGTNIASGSGDGTIRVWDGQTGKMVMGPLQAHTGPVFSVAFSPDGTRIVSGLRDMTIQVWDARTGRNVMEPLRGPTTPVLLDLFSPIDIRVPSDSEHANSVFSVAFSPDGMRIASGSGRKAIHVWDLQTGQMVVGPLLGHTDSVFSVAFSPDSRYIVSGSGDTTIRLWDVQSKRMTLEPLQGHTSSVLSVAFSPDGMRIISGSWDRTIRVWDAQSGQMLVGSLQGHTHSVLSVAFSADGGRIVSGSADSTIRVWDARTGLRVIGPLWEHTAPVLSVAFSPNGKSIASGSADRTLRLWDARTGRMAVGPLEEHTSSILSVAFSPDSTRIVSGSEDQTLRVWDAQTGEMVMGPLWVHTKSVLSVAYSPDGRCIVSGSGDNTIRVWDARTGQMVVGPLLSHTDSVLSVGFSPNGRCVVSGSRDMTIRVWDPRQRQMVVRPLQEHPRSVRSVAFSPDGRSVASGCEDGTIRMWDTQTGQMMMGPLQAHADSVISIAFSPDNLHIVSASADRTIRMWDVLAGQLVGPLQAHAPAVYSVSFSPHGGSIVSGPTDNPAHAYEAPPMTQTQNVTPFHGVSSWEINSDGWAIDEEHRLLLWVPHDLRDRLLRPPNTIIISIRGFAQISFDHAAIGESWTECYQPAEL